LVGLPDSFDHFRSLRWVIHWVIRWIMIGECIRWGPSTTAPVWGNDSSLWWCLGKTAGSEPEEMNVALTPRSWKFLNFWTDQRTCTVNSVNFNLITLITVVWKRPVPSVLSLCGSARSGTAREPHHYRDAGGAQHSARKLRWASLQADVLSQDVVSKSS
jgi:hypothetical protein